MARSLASRTVVVQKYYWPDAQLNVWTIIMLVTGATILGVFASFITIQQQMDLGIPWLFPYGVTVGALLVLFILVELVLIAQRRLLPGVMIVGSFILFVLFLTGVIATAIQLFGDGNVNESCNQFVYDNESEGVSLTTLAWLQQKNICDSWLAAFSFWIIGSVFLVWMIIMGLQVSKAAHN